MKIRKDFVERGENLTVSFVQNKARKYEMKRQQFFKLLLIFFYNKEKQMTHKIVPLVSWGNKKVTTIYNVNEIYWPYVKSREHVFLRNVTSS